MHRLTALALRNCLIVINLLEINDIMTMNALLGTETMADEMDMQQERSESLLVSELLGITENQILEQLSLHKDQHDRVMMIALLIVFEQQRRVSVSMHLLKMRILPLQMLDNENQVRSQLRQDQADYVRLQTMYNKTQQI